MHQKWFSWGDDFHIKDSNGVDLFLVDGHTFSVGDKFSFQDANGNELASIAQRLLSWGPTYGIHVRDKLYATVKKKMFTLFKCKFEVDMPGPDDLEASDDFLDHKYAFSLHGSTVARASKRWFRWTDTYGIDVANGDDLLILASAVAIDLVCHDSDD